VASRATWSGEGRLGEEAGLAAALVAKSNVERHGASRRWSSRVVYPDRPTSASNNSGVLRIQPNP
jgi:hypothetical protein